jgi:hypothetical protein
MYWGNTATMACESTQTKTASNVLCGCENSAELRRHCLGKHFTKPRVHDKILSVMQETLLFTRDGTLEECKIWGMHNKSENGHSARVILCTYCIYSHIHSLMMRAVSTSETLTDFCNTIRYKIQAVSHLFNLFSSHFQSLIP